MSGRSVHIAAAVLCFLVLGGCARTDREVATGTLSPSTSSGQNRDLLEVLSAANVAAVAAAPPAFTAELVQVREAIERGDYALASQRIRMLRQLRQPQAEVEPALPADPTAASPGPSRWPADFAFGGKCRPRSGPIHDLPARTFQP